MTHFYGQYLSAEALVENLKSSAELLGGCFVNPRKTDISLREILTTVYGIRKREY